MKFPEPDFDVTNYMAIEILETLGIGLPTEAQINFIETLLGNVVIKKNLLFDRRLTSAECHCLQFIAHGHSVVQIAEFFKVEPHEIERLKYSLMKKMECKTLEQCVFEGMRFGHLPDRRI
jgi:DNA-binding CsgD family transcriptional regulator